MWSPRARKSAADVLADVAARSETARKVHDSYAAFRERTAPWSHDFDQGRARRTGLIT